MRSWYLLLLKMNCVTSPESTEKECKTECESVVHWPSLGHPPARSLMALLHQLGLPIKGQLKIHSTVVLLQDSHLKAFSHNPTDGSFTPLAPQRSSYTKCSVWSCGFSHAGQDHYCNICISRMKVLMRCCDIVILALSTVYPAPRPVTNATSSFLHLSNTVRVEWPHRITHYQTTSFGCSGECFHPKVKLACNYYDNEVYFSTLPACGGVVKDRIRGGMHRRWWMETEGEMNKIWGLIALGSLHA